MSAFITQQRVRFGHVDPAGIVYFPRIYDYFHEAFEELFDVHVGVKYYEMLLEDRIGFPLVHSEANFNGPLKFGDRPLVRVTCFKLGETSLGLHYVYEVDDKVCVDAHQTTVCVNTKTMKPQRIPDAFRARFEEILESREDQ